MATLHQQLNIPRDQARQMGLETLAILQRGFYLTGSGKRVDIREMVQKSVAGTVTYMPDESLTATTSGIFLQVAVRNTTTLAAARDLVDAGYAPAALNLASATSPGGGFLKGSRAQEEYLARSSALYACLVGSPMYDREDFHTNPFYDDYVIYSPQVAVIRDDDGALLEDPFPCSMITSPAVQANGVRTHMPDRIGEIEGIMWKRILKVLAVAKKHGHTALVLGAWGCGALGNDGSLIARLFRTALRENFNGAFEKVVFAITDWSPELRFIGPFMDEFKS